MPIFMLSIEKMREELKNSDKNIGDIKIYGRFI